MFERVVMALAHFGMQVTFGLAAIQRKGRGTHCYGAAGKGTLRIVDDPKFPEHDLFVAGRTFPVQLRHATLGMDDGAGKDARGAALKLSDHPQESPLDLIMNSGSRSVFWNTRSFYAFMKGALGGPKGLEAYSRAYPQAYVAAMDTARRAPESFAKVQYAAMITFRFQAKDGTEHLCKYRLLPEDRGDSGVPTGDDLSRPWDQQRLPTETRPLDYLQTEYVARVKRGPVTYHLEIQLHRKTDQDDPALYDSSALWDEATHPWMPLATVTITEPLRQHEAEDLRFLVENQPPTLGLWPATSIDDYNSLAWLRVRVYPWSRFFRYAMYRLTGRFGPPQLPAYEPKALPKQWVVTGTLVHADEREEPLHHVLVRLVDKDLTHRDVLGYAETDRSGRFEIRYDPKDAGKHDRPDLLLEVLALDRTRDEHDNPVQHERLVAEIPGPQDAEDASAFHFGRLRVWWWEYDHSLGLPRCGNDPKGHKPQKYADGYVPELVADAGLFSVIHEAHRVMAHAKDASLTLDRVQKDYDAINECLTIKAERQDPGKTRSNEWFGFRVLNGFNPCIPEIVPTPPGSAPGSPTEYKVAFNWDAYESDGVHDVANVDGRFLVIGGKFLPKSITVSFRERGETRAGAPTTEPVTYTPADGEQWEAAKRVFRQSWNVAGECDAHLSEAHLNVEQYAVAAYRNLRKNPIRDLLFPHLREVVLINGVGDTAIFGTNGVLATNTPLTADAARQRLAEHLGRLDWTGWRPRKPICEDHQYAHVANLWWDVLTEYVGAFFAAHEAEIAANWYEVWRFSDDLVRNSVALTLDDAPRDYYDDGEIDKPIEREVREDESVPTVRPITANPDAPDAGELDDLQQVCRYVIFHATLRHTWSNDRQVEDGGEIRYGSLALRAPSLGTGDDVLPPPFEASGQLFFAHSLNAQTRGLVWLNEDKDIPKRLVELLHAKHADFQKLGFEPGRIRSRINI